MKQVVLSEESTKDNSRQSAPMANVFFSMHSYNRRGFNHLRSRPSSTNPHKRIVIPQHASTCYTSVNCNQNFVPRISSNQKFKGQRGGFAEWFRYRDNLLHDLFGRVCKVTILNQKMKLCASSRFSISFVLFFLSVPMVRYRICTLRLLNDSRDCRLFEDKKSSLYRCV